MTWRFSGEAGESSPRFAAAGIIGCLASRQPRQFGPVNIGIEAGHEGASERGGYGRDTAGLGLIAAVGDPFAIVARAGPAREEHTGHVFVQTYFGLQGVFDPKK